MSRVMPYLGLALAGMLPVLALVVTSYWLAGEAIERGVHEGNEASAALAAVLVERDFTYWQHGMATHAEFPVFAAAIAEGNIEEVRKRLGIIVDGHPDLVRGFVTDLEGNLWVDYPIASESLGGNFSDRDWYRGVSSTSKPYVSEVYRRNASPAVNVVAIAVPVWKPDTRELSGLLVVQLSLERLSTQLQQIEVGDGGHVLMLDHNGRVAAHPLFDPTTEDYTGYAESAADVRANGSREAGVIYTDPYLKREVLASVRPVPVVSVEWTIIAQQPLDAAYGPIRVLKLQLIAVAALVLLLVAVMFGALARVMGRTRSLNEQLTNEVGQRTAAEEALRVANESLERDVEDRTAELHTTQQQLLHSQKLEAVGRLAGGIAHDFNNMLSVIIGYSEVALLGLEEGSSAHKQIKQVHDAGVRAANLTRQLLAFSRKQIMQPEIISVNRVIERMHDMLERLLGEDVKLVCKLAPDLDAVRFDPGQIEQVLMNLAINARDAMPDGGKLMIETANVELDDDYARAHPESSAGPHVMLAVSDTGMGMDAATLENIYEPFFTTKGEGKGTGLGLPTVYGIVKQGGGNIWVYSEPGRGTTFKVYFPKAEGKPGKSTTPAPEAQEQRTGTVLVVEDRDDVRSLIVEVLSGVGYTVLEVGDGEAAVAAQQAHDGPLDLLLTDVVLPGKRGPEIAADLVAKQPGLKVLYMSGYTDNAIVHHGVLDPGVSFLSKPIRPRELLAKVHEVLTGA